MRRSLLGLILRSDHTQESAILAEAVFAMSPLTEILRLDDICVTPLPLNELTSTCQTGFGWSESTYFPGGLAEVSLGRSLQAQTVTLVLPKKCLFPSSL